LAASIASSVVGVDKRLANPMSAALLVSEGVRLGGWIAPFDLRVRWESSATSHVLSVCSISQHWWPQQHNGPAWGGLLSQYSFFGLHFLRSSAETLIKGPQMQKAHHWSAAQLVHAYVITNVFCVSRVTVRVSGNYGAAFVVAAFSCILRGR
jgi:hypothetical protein